jgi:hypothetical protein
MLPAAVAMNPLEITGGMACNDDGAAVAAAAT